MARVIDAPLGSGLQWTAARTENNNAQAWRESVQRAMEANASRASAGSAGNNIVDYRVKEGDSLWSISQQYRVPFGDVLKANPQFSNPNLIYPGDTVHVPVGGAPYAGHAASSRCAGRPASSRRAGRAAFSLQVLRLEIAVFESRHRRCVIALGDGDVVNGVNAGVVGGRDGDLGAIVKLERDPARAGSRRSRRCRW
jgi:spore coat assembly protein SafA